MPTGVYKHRKGLGIWNKGSKRSDETKKKMSKARSEENGYQWKGDNVGKNALHDWVKKHLGYPNKCEHCGLISENHNKIHWANKSHKYKRDLSDWLRLCVKCHSKYDMTPEKLKTYQELIRKNAKNRHIIKDYLISPNKE